MLTVTGTDECTSRRRKYCVSMHVEMEMSNDYMLRKSQSQVFSLVVIDD